MVLILALKITGFGIGIGIGLENAGLYFIPGYSRPRPNLQNIVKRS